MSESILSFNSSEEFRKKLITRNLPPYRVDGVYNPPSTDQNYVYTQSDSQVLDSPDDLIKKNPYANVLYPLNQFGPDGGYGNSINFNGPPLPIASNSGPYEPADTKLDLVNEFYIDVAYTQNIYGPEGGYLYMYETTDIQNNNKVYQPYWDPISFVPGNYTPYDVILLDFSENGRSPLSQDSYLSQISAKELQRTLKYRAALESLSEINLKINVEGYTQPDAANTALRANAPLSSRDYQVTIPPEQDTFLNRIGGTYSPVSPIPGDYFMDDLKTRYTTSIGQLINVVAGQSTLLGEILGPGLTRYVNPSQIFLQYTTDGQKSALFGNLSYNRYRPAYQNTVVGGLFGNLLTTGVNNLIEPTGTQLPGDYYVGSVISDPSYIESPVTQVPINEFGKETGAPVLGPQAKGIEYEGNENNIIFGPQAKSFSDGGGLDGDFVWVSPKYKDDAGFKVGVGGKIFGQDEDFNLISNDYENGLSTRINFKPGSILDETQRLVDAADRARGASRFKHVGNAINQVSKVFNDGYREMTKGSKVLSYVDNATGSEVGREYARVFAKDTPYYTFRDLQKFQGITKNGRTFNYSILDSTYNLNIAPLRGTESTNIVDGKVKKYMFSIENLAWKSGNKPGFTYDSLPVCERGPNGGRIMWFPPYDIKFSENSTPTFNPTSFLGRPEPIYTYKETRRNGSLSWKIIVDHPSVLNLIVDKVLGNGVTADKANSIIDSFFAGCAKYDLYELAIRYNTVPVDQLKSYQDIISDPRLTTEETAQNIVNTIPKDNTSKENSNLSSNPDTPSFNEFENTGFYYEKDSGSSLVDPTDAAYNTVNVIKDYIGNVVTPDFKKITNGLVDSLSKLLEQNKLATVNIEVEGVCSYRDDSNFGQKLSQERADYLKSLIIDDSRVSPYKDRITISSKGLSYTTSVTPKSNFDPVDCSEDKLGNPTTYTTFVCNTAYIKKINAVTPPPQGQANEETNPNAQTAQNPSTSAQSIKPVPAVDVNERIKKNIGKKVLRHLLSECDYFQVLKDTDPMYYDSMKEKIKFFNPTFHSTTPEGLNARLTFLQQCMRPGDTLPTIGPDGKPRFNDASNTAFGTPPILVLRIGDFYNTKIVPTSLQISYEPLVFDMNPEGIGVQPMIANISLGFDFIGGSGLARPIEKLQNALSFNYFANTEIYDERADATEDTSAIDKKIFDALIPPVTKSSVNKPIENKGGATIGVVTSATTTSGITTGIITYQKIFDEFLDKTQAYFDGVTNYMTNVVEEYNFGTLIMSTTDRQYQNGGSGTSSESAKLFGKPDNLEKTIKDVYDQVKNDVDGNIDPLYLQFTEDYLNKGSVYLDKDLRQFKRNYEKYVKGIEETFSSEITNKMNELVSLQVDYVQYFRKLNFVENGTSNPSGYDGYVDDKGDVVIYDTSGKTLSSPSAYPDTLAELRADYSNVSSATSEFNTLLIDKKLIDDNTGNNFKEESGFGYVYQYPQPSDAKVVKGWLAYYIIMSRTYLNSSELDNFKKAISNGFDTRNEENKLLKSIDETIAKLTTIFEEQHSIDVKIIKDFTGGSDIVPYSKFNNISKGKTREFDFTSNNSPPNAIKKDMKNLYKDVNDNNDKETFNGKVKFK